MRASPRFITTSAQKPLRNRIAAWALACGGALFLSGLIVADDAKPDKPGTAAPNAPASAPAASEPANDNGWKPLFDGKTLAGWKVTEFGGQGEVEVQEGAIRLGMSDGCTGVTYQKPFPKVDYEVRLQAMRVEGSDFFCGMTFPVQESPLTLIIGGWGGTVVGLSSLDGEDAARNETARYQAFESKRWYAIRLRVTAEDVTAWIDDKKVVDQPIKGRKLSIRAEVEPSRPFGIASWCTTAALKNIEVRTFGQDKAADPPAAASPKTSSDRSPAEPSAPPPKPAGSTPKEPKTADEPRVRFNETSVAAGPRGLPVRPVADVATKSQRPGDDWPQFLGPRGDGVSTETGLLISWPAGGPPLVWKRKIGTGYSAPSITENLLVLFHREQDEEVVEAFTADGGEPRWRHAYATQFEDPYGYNNGPRCTPLLTKTRCYTFGAEGKLTCLALETGRRIWQRDTAADFSPPSAFFGVGSTPILEDNLLIAIVGGKNNAGVVAFDAETGRTVWQNVNLRTWDDKGARHQRDDKLAGYASPMAVTIHGQRHVLCFMRPGLVSLNPRSGEIQFSYFFRSVLRESVNAARPVVVDDLILLSAAYDVGAVLLQVPPGGTSCRTVWRDEEVLQCHWSTPLHDRGYVYGFSGRHEAGATLRCVELKTGKLMWQTRDLGEEVQQNPRFAKTPTPKFLGRGSGILVDKHLVLLGERGLLLIAKANPERYDEIASVQLPEMHYPTWAAPVLSRERLYIRGEDRLICLDVSGQSAVGSKSGQSAVGSRQWAVGSGQSAVKSRQWAVGSGQ